MLDRLKVGEGDTLYLVEAPDGYRMTAQDPDFERQLGTARKSMRRYRNALRELAK